MSFAVESAPVAEAAEPSTAVLVSLDDGSQYDGGVSEEQSAVLTVVSPVSPSLSAYTETAATVVDHSDAASEAPTLLAPASAALNQTQPLPPPPPTAHLRRPSSESSGRARSGRLVSVSRSGAAQLPFYAQALQPPSASSTHPLAPRHMASLPLSAVLAHVSKANSEALELMKRKMYQGAFERLKRAEAFCAAPVVKRARDSASVTLRASTYNNLAILFKSVHQLRRALWYANRALRLEINFTPSADNNAAATSGTSSPRPNPAGTHLNMCAILSSLGRHGSALLHAECALSSLYLELHQMAVTAQHAKRERTLAAAARRRARREARGESFDSNGEPLEDSDSESTSGESASGTASSSSSSDRASLLALIAVAMHNMAVNQEFLRQYRAATHSYRRAYEFASRRLGVDHVMTRTIEHAYEGAANLHPLKVIAPSQSMNPHAKLTVANAAATAASETAQKNKWLVPALENDPMTARHIPVRPVPFNQFVSVSGLPGREPRAPSTRTTPNGGNGRRLASAPSGQQGGGRRVRAASRGEEKESGEFAPYQFDGDDGVDAEPEDDDPSLGPHVSEAALRARHAAQQRLLGPPSHPPPAGLMNAEEDDNATSAELAAAGDDAGYWSDPELSELPPNGDGSRVKAKMDPRTAARARMARPSQQQPGQQRRNSKLASSLPTSNSTGTLEPSARLAASAAGPFGGVSPLPPHHQQQQQQQQQQQYQQPLHTYSQHPYPPPSQPYAQAYPPPVHHAPYAAYPPPHAYPYGGGYPTEYAPPPSQTSNHAMPYGAYPSPPSATSTHLPSVYAPHTHHAPTHARPPFAPAAAAAADPYARHHRPLPPQQQQPAPYGHAPYGYGYATAR